jgi:heme A synthase
MTTLLRIAALLCLAWAVLLPLMSRSQPDVAVTGVALADALAAANLVFAYVFWRAASRDERTAVYAALLLFGLRAVSGTYQVLYQLEGRAAVVSLLDMVTSLALFVGMLNTLPNYLRRPGAPAERGESRES